MTEITGQLPPCPLPDCKGGEHHYHDTYAYTIRDGHACATEPNLDCYGPSLPRWQPIELAQIRAGMRIRVTSPRGDRMTTHVGVAHHQDVGTKIWFTEARRMLTGWGNPVTYEVDPATIPAIPDTDAELIPDPDAELIDALREASWLIESSGQTGQWIGTFTEARDLLNKLRELGWTVIRESERCCIAHTRRDDQSTTTTKETPHV